ncbi:MAG: Diaminopimelate epimerase [Syntrophus sp. PtaU1.Bin005]|jgi:diaminopimelate epimerase|uniref:diaminopimelate epimerase n=1 Tax=Syntrophus TaxID=43773 RepID=UPI0009C7D52F|nr:MAG: Diaminopimelate epimerase [Syntrophus sp. PtaB.Bin138]OPY80268.1 MAG: Diaminopimelate epimerase [Syntrophus sp. PtaU1.Bin005]
MKYLKYHALGNDYIVLRPEAFEGELSGDIVRLICHRNYGVGSDGILYGPVNSLSCDFGLRIFNPDGSEAEKSGNGLRIFARSLYDEGLVGEQSFSVETPGGVVSCKVEDRGKVVSVKMGEVRFDSTSIPVAGPPREVLNETMDINGRIFTFCAATVGNPHCVVLSDDPSSVDAHHYGPLIENDPRFPNRTNVQFMKVLDRGNIQIEIWERGAGYTLASGSSSTAAAAVACKLGRCGSDITVHMPGGKIGIQFSKGFFATMTGPVTRVCEGNMDQEMFEGTGL